ncbi:hypothetical protein HK405_003607, partial [Cladochytrium tenue]
MDSPDPMTSIAGSRSTSDSSASQSTRNDRGRFSSGATSSDSRNLGDGHALGRLIDSFSTSAISASGSAQDDVSLVSLLAYSSTEYFNDYASGESGSSSRMSDELGNLSVGAPHMPQQRRLDRRADIQGQEKRKKRRDRNKEKQRDYDGNRKVKRLELMLYKCQKNEFEEGVQYQAVVARLLQTFWSHQSPEQYPHQMMTFTQDAIKAAKRKVASFADSAKWRLPLPAEVKSSFKYLMETCIPSNYGVTIPEFFELLFQLRKSNHETVIMELVTHRDNVDLIENMRRNITDEVVEFLGLPLPNPGQTMSATRSATPSARLSLWPPALRQPPPPSLPSLAYTQTPEILNNLVNDVVAFATGNNTRDAFIDMSNLPSSAEDIERYWWQPTAPFTAPVSMLPYSATGLDEQQQALLAAIDPGFSLPQVAFSSLHAPSSSSSVASTPSIPNLTPTGYRHDVVTGGPSQRGSFSPPDPPSYAYFTDLSPYMVHELAPASLGASSSQDEAFSPLVPLPTMMPNFASVATPAVPVSDDFVLDVGDNLHRVRQGNFDLLLQPPPPAASVPHQADPFAQAAPPVRVMPVQAPTTSSMRLAWVPQESPGAMPQVMMRLRRDPGRGGSGQRYLPMYRDLARQRKPWEYIWTRQANKSDVSPLPTTYATPPPDGDGDGSDGADGSEHESHWAAELGPPDWAERIKRPVPFAL